VTSLDLAAVLKQEIQKQHEIISKATRRRNVLEHYVTRLRLGKDPKVVQAELEAAGEPIDLMESE
jgi:hypothetical protein